jgi:hypothetical protein
LLILPAVNPCSIGSNCLFDIAACILLPGTVNCHHHFVVDSSLPLGRAVPVGALLIAEARRASARLIRVRRLIVQHFGNLGTNRRTTDGPPASIFHSADDANNDEHDTREHGRRCYAGNLGERFPPNVQRNDERRHEREHEEHVEHA